MNDEMKEWQDYQNKRWTEMIVSNYFIAYNVK